MYNEIENRMIIVFGEGAVKVTPDTVHIVLTVQTRGMELQEIQQENAQNMHKVIGSLVELGIPEPAIQTIDYQIRPVNDYINGEQVFRGYEVVNTIRITSNELSKVGEIVDTAVKNGVNQIGSIDFTVQNSDEFYQKALTLALHDAETKMVTIGSSLKLANRPLVMKVEEQHTSQPVAFRAMAMADTVTPIESGTLTISASLLVKYRIV
ncbi:SIMPL domain-containing protein [Sporosarcina sp. GW1-11]|uniref:SIMPL domain-containing protein n=1 Tax=Sporosarcina sp. GW1-11 TaxID=2899126 RepID=UPI00294EA68A|nr:SIMPL domain-containing protein [Sporosarcina sp. GW1-11]MDV6378172.1 SIMPL domain-containing protein [Sporosarcina sp. GW1-11]